AGAVDQRAQRSAGAEATHRLHFIAVQVTIAVVVQPGELPGHARHRLLHLDLAQAAILVEVGLGEVLGVALGALGAALVPHRLAPGLDLGAHEVTVAVGVDRVELLREPGHAAAFAGQFGAGDAAVLVLVEHGDAAAMHALHGAMVAGTVVAG